MHSNVPIKTLLAVPVASLVAYIDDPYPLSKGPEGDASDSEGPSEGSRDCWELVGQDELVVGLWAKEAGQKPASLDKIKEMFGFEREAKTFKRDW